MLCNLSITWTLKESWKKSSCFKIHQFRQAFQIPPATKKVESVDFLFALYWWPLSSIRIYSIRWNHYLLTCVVTLAQLKSNVKKLLYRTLASLSTKLDTITKLSCADPEVRQSNTEENLLYFIRKKHNRFWTPSLICRMSRSAYGSPLS